MKCSLKFKVRSKKKQIIKAEWMKGECYFFSVNEERIEVSTKRITEFGLLLAISLVFAYLESLLPVVIAVPGVKLGLANVVTMLVLYRSGFKNAFFFMSLRVVMAGILFSGLAGILYSFAGGLFSIITMQIARRCSFFSTIGVSMIGAVFHNAGQIITAMLVMENAHILYYFPVLCVTGIVTGFLTGYVSYILFSKYNKFFPLD